MAFCAACQQTIVDRQSFVISGCEVLHRECARRPHTTVGQHFRQSAADANARAARAERMLSDHRAEDSRERAAIDRAHARDVRDLRREITTLQGDVAAARREAALHQVLAREPTIAAPAAAHAAAPSSVVEINADPGDTRTDAEIRFSLMDLDPL